MKEVVRMHIGLIRALLAPLAPEDREEILREVCGYEKPKPDKHDERAL